MIGPLEIVILIFIVLLVTGLYRKLPALGRSAGTGARVGGEKAREFADRATPKAKELAGQASAKGSEVGAKVSEHIDPADIGRKAGSAAREARDMRAEFKGFLDAPAPSSRAKDGAPGPAADTAPRPDGDGTNPTAEGDGSERSSTS